MTQENPLLFQEQLDKLMDEAKFNDEGKKILFSIIELATMKLDLMQLEIDTLTKEKKQLNERVTKPYTNEMMARVSNGFSVVGPPQCESIPIPGLEEPGDYKKLWDAFLEVLEDRKKILEIGVEGQRRVNDRQYQEKLLLGRLLAKAVEQRNWWISENVYKNGGADAKRDEEVDKADKELKEVQ